MAASRKALSRRVAYGEEASGTHRDAFSVALRLRDGDADDADAGASAGRSATNWPGRVKASAQRGPSCGCAVERKGGGRGGVSGRTAEKAETEKGGLVA
jgi:hypothetical protein